MNNLRYRLSLLFFTIAILCAPSIGFSQEYSGFSQDRKLTRKEKKEARKAGLQENFKAIETLLDQKTFVLEAEYLQNRYGGDVPVSSDLNFIKVDQSAVILQTGSNSAIGYNGVGGVTAEGNLNAWKVTRDTKRMNYTVFFSTTTNIGTYDVLLRIGADASATATITGMTRGSLTYRGNLVAPYNSRVFKGQRTM